MFRRYYYLFITDLWISEGIEKQIGDDKMTNASVNDGENSSGISSGKSKNAFLGIRLV